MGTLVYAHFLIRYLLMLEAALANIANNSRINKLTKKERMKNKHLNFVIDIIIFVTTLRFPVSAEYWRHCVLLCRRALPFPEQLNDNIKYFISSSGNRTHNLLCSYHYYINFINFQTSKPTNYRLN